METSNKAGFDKALESLDKGACLCWSCVEKHYPEEFKLRNNFFVYRRYCDSCGEKKDDCTWTSLWRGIIFTTKPLDYLIRRFEEDARHHGSLLSINGSDAGWEIIKRGKKALENVFRYLERNPNTSPDAWLYFCEHYARHHNFVDNSFIFPETISTWKKILDIEDGFYEKKTENSALFYEIWGGGNLPDLIKNRQKGNSDEYHKSDGLNLNGLEFVFSKDDD